MKIHNFYDLGKMFLVMLKSLLFASQHLCLMHIWSRTIYLSLHCTYLYTLVQLYLAFCIYCSFFPFLYILHIFYTYIYNILSQNQNIFSVYIGYISSIKDNFNYLINKNFQGVLKFKLIYFAESLNK